MERVVTDNMGYSLTFRIEGERMLIIQNQVKNKPVVSLTRNDVDLLRAFIDRAIKLGAYNHPNEELVESGVELSYHNKPQELVRIVQGNNQIDIISTSWTPAECEIALMAPRIGQGRRAGTVH
jgi:hypothetical protein